MRWRLQHREPPPRVGYPAWTNKISAGSAILVPVALVLWLIGGQARSIASVLYTVALAGIAAILITQMITPNAWQRSTAWAATLYGRHANWAFPTFMRSRTFGWVSASFMSLLVAVRIVDHLT